MTTYAITGATGRLGRLVVETLLSGGTSPSDIVAIVRTPSKAADLADAGVQVRRGDYTAQGDWAAALAGVDTLLLISSSEVGQRVSQHEVVINAAKAAGVTRIAYTSILRADSTEIALAPDHRATEELLLDSGLTYTFLRNSWYLENYTAQLGQYLADRAITSASGDGRIAAAVRADYAAAAAAALVGSGHENKIYELGGAAFTLGELAALVTELSGTEVEYRSITGAELIGLLTAAGVDAGTAGFVAALDEATARGDLDTDSADLVTLIGRPSTPIREVVQAAL